MKTRAGLLMALTLILALLIAGCGSDSSDETAAGTSGNTNDAAGGFDPAPFEELAASAEGPFAFPEVPASPPPKAGAKVAAIMCPLELEGCKADADGIEEAADQLGYSDVLILDTEGKPAKTVASFEQAKQLGYEGLVLVALDPTVSKPYIAAARGRGVEVVGLGMGSPDGYNANPSPTGLSGEYQREEERLGEISAANLILESEGKAKLLMLSIPEFETIAKAEEGFLKVFEQCTECEIAETIQFTAPDTTTSLPTQVKAKLTADSGINAVWAGSDAFLVAVNPAIEGLGRDDVHTYAIDGQVASVESISEEGVQAQTLSTPPYWQAFAAMDQLNRVLNGEPPVTVNGIPFMAVNAGNADEFLNDNENPIDFRAEYGQLWGVK